MTAVTVFTFSDPSQGVRDSTGRMLRALVRGASGRVIGDNVGTGEWEGTTEHSGALVVSGISRGVATSIALLAADVHDQDAIGVVHSANGRTLARPGNAWLTT